jgi:hypothetical protein
VVCCPSLEWPGVAVCGPNRKNPENPKDGANLFGFLASIFPNLGEILFFR